MKVQRETSLSSKCRFDLETNNCISNIFRNTSINSEVDLVPGLPEIETLAYETSVEF